MSQQIPDIDFSRIRCVNGSQRTGFEELCCQIAELERQREPELANAKYSRKAGEGGDAGVEGYYESANGDEWCWQAKYFFRLGKKQWEQIDDSISNALKKHPRLVRYTICLPIDLSEGRKKKELSQRDHWNRHVEKWTGWAEGQDRQIHFEYWGAFQLRQRLTELANERAGYLCYWFDQKLLTDDWFQSRLSETIKNAGPRYTPEIHVELPVAISFDAFGRTRTFSETIKSLYSSLLRKWKKAKPWALLETNLPEITVSFEDVGQRVNELANCLMTCANEPFNALDFQRTHDLARQILEATEECHKIANKEELQKHYAVRDRSASGQYVPSASELISAFAYGLRELDGIAEELIEFSLGDEASISNHSVLLLSGEAGTGKTHLMCDVARKRLEQGLPTVLLLGQNFSASRGPWPQIIEGLHLADMEPERFLGALDAAGQLAGHKSLIMIDALNEGEGIDLWSNHLRGMRQFLQNFPRVSLAVSCRDTYESAIVPGEMLDELDMARVVHRGFEGHEYDTSKIFFFEYNIENLGSPLLIPEFSNPLFLKLFAKGLHNMGLTKIPKGLQGITRLFSFYIDSVDHILAKKLGYDEADHLARKAVEALVGHMADRHTPWLERQQAKQLVGTIRPEPQGQKYERTLYRNLIHEGLLMEDLHWSRDNADRIQITRFAYERLANHLTIAHWTKNITDSKSLSEICQEIDPLRRLVSEEPFAQRHGGWLYALSIQAPEKAGCELIDAFPDTKRWHISRMAFLSSLMWRNPKSVTAAAKEFLSELWKTPRFRNDTYDVMLMVSAEPGHLLNSMSLHQHLSEFNLADRDAVWSIYLHENYGDNGPIDRLIDWAWEDNDKSWIDDEVIRLAGITLAWFFTSANRFLRDRATKAMVRLFENRTDLLRLVMKEFIKVNDPYVAERLYAVAYGCAMRTMDQFSLKDLAQDVYQWVFEDAAPPAHVLMRDYARGVIEMALHNGADLNTDIARVRPPYRSEWPALEIAESDDLEKWGEWRQDIPDEEWARINLHNSVMGGGTVSDFSHYVVGYLDEWSSERTDSPHKPTHRELHDQFVESLTERQKAAWDLYWRVRRFVDDYRKSSSDQKEIYEQQFTENELDALIPLAESRLVKALGKNSRKYRLFLDSVLPYKQDPSKYYHENRFDVQLARKWIMKRVIDLGWTVDRFGKFDRNVNCYGPDSRGSHKPERIGKKYQWIAYHELLARLSDNFRMSGHGMPPDRRVAYNGPWDLGHARDIDPSNLLAKTLHEEWSPNTNTWWFPTQFDSWNEPADKVEWLKQTDNLPNVRNIMEITNSLDDSDWLTLSGFYQWEQPIPHGEDRYEVERRELWYMLRCYLVKKSESNKLLKWATEQTWFGGWMPESHTFYEIFLGEFGWSPAFKDIDCYYYGHEGWTCKDGDIPAEILLACETYGQESNGFDCSIDENIFIDLPCKLLIDGMNLTWRGAEGEWYDSDGKIVACDPSVKSRGPRALLFRRDALLDFLHRHGLTVFWTLIGEKQMIGGHMSHRDYKGTLEINGTYFLKARKVSGKKLARFVAPGEKRRDGRPTG